MKTFRTDISDIAKYSKKQKPEYFKICEVLRKEINKALSKNSAKIYYKFPVWFVGESPVLGYKAASKYVNLLFWNGRAFKEKGLIPVGKYKAAQIKYTDVSQIKIKSLRSWLKEAKTLIWDFHQIQR